MYNIIQSDEFKKWLRSIRDKTSKIRIINRIENMSSGTMGDTKMISSNLYEARLFFGSGYRLYYTLKNNELIILLVGGDKSTQTQDIQKAIRLLEKFKE